MRCDDARGTVPLGRLPPMQQAEYDALDARALVVTQEREIDAALLAHYVEKYSDHPTAAATIRRLNISPHMLAPLSFLRLNEKAIDAVRYVVGDPELWKLVCAAWTALMRVTASQLETYTDSLNRRLETTAADLDLVSRSVPAPSVRTGLKLPSVGLTAVSATTAAASSAYSCLYNRRFADPAEVSPFASVLPSATPPPSYKFGTKPPNASISVHYSSGYHCTRADCHGPDTVNPHHPVCHFHGCTREWPLHALKAHGSLPVYFLCTWKTYCCSEHLDVLADFVKRSVLFCHSCGQLESVSYYSTTCDRLTVPLCVECTKKPYVMRQFEVFLRRQWRVGLGTNRRRAMYVSSTTHHNAPKSVLSSTLELPKPADEPARPLDITNPTRLFGPPLSSIMECITPLPIIQPIVGGLSQPTVLNLVDSPSDGAEIDDESTDHGDGLDDEYLS